MDPSIMANDGNTISEAKRGGTAPRPRSRRLLVRCLAVLVGLLPIVLLEAGLRVFDIGKPADATDPLAGFNRYNPLFEKQGNVYRTVHARAPFFPPQEFQAQKPKGTFRFFTFGGSTVHGHPYEWETSFPQWLQMELGASDTTHTYQSVNCGGVSYASYREAPIVKEVLGYQPDLIIVATGHNEFLEDRTYQAIKQRSSGRAWLEDTVYSLRTVNLARTWMHGHAQGGDPAEGENKSRLPREVWTRLDEKSGYASYHRDDAWQNQVVAQFNDSMREIVRLCKEAKVPLLLAKPGSNLRDCPPYKSEHKAGISPEEERAWQEAFDAGTAAEEEDAARALTFYRKAESIDHEYALLTFRIARILDHQGHYDDARKYYQLAKEQDICSVRMIKQLEDSAEKIAAETHTPYVDINAMLAGLCRDGIPSNEWYLDHVHPNIGGHQKIAQLIATKLRDEGIVPKGSPWPEDQRRVAYEKQLKQLGPTYFANGQRRVDWLESWARRERLTAETWPHDARAYLHLGFRRFDLTDEEGAWRSFAQAIRMDPAMVKPLKQHVEDLRSQGRPEAARDLEEHLPALVNPKEGAGK